MKENGFEPQGSVRLLAGRDLVPIP